MEFTKPPKDQIKTILVDNCQECPFMHHDNSDGYNVCTENIEEINTPYDLPSDKVHDKCPLKNMNYRIRLE